MRGGYWLKKKLLRCLGTRPACIIPAPAQWPQVDFLVRLAQGTRLHGRLEFGGNNLVASEVHVGHGLRLGYASTLSEGCWFRGPVTVGNYCQFGPRVCLQAADHPIRHLTPYNSWGLFAGELKRFTAAVEIRVGHGVWCGYGAIILKGVSLGNGSIVGAGAVVTRDVPPYAIAAGNPARVIGTRFEPDLCELLEQSLWWTHTVKELERFRPAFEVNFASDPAQLREAAQRFIAAGPGTAPGDYTLATRPADA